MKLDAMVRDVAHNGFVFSAVAHCVWVDLLSAFASVFQIKNEANWSSAPAAYAWVACPPLYRPPIIRMTALSASTRASAAARVALGNRSRVERQKRSEQGQCVSEVVKFENILSSMAALRDAISSHNFAGTTPKNGWFTIEHEKK